MDPQYWQALVDGDRRTALAVVKRLRAEGASTARIVEEQLLVAQRRVGDLWAAGEWTVAQENAATSVNEGLLLWLGSFTEAPDPDGPLVVVGCVEDERHALAALVVAEVLMSEGVRVDYVGPAPDGDEMVRHVAAQRPRAVLLSASLTSSLGRATDVVRRLRAQEVPVVVGGQAFGDDERRARAIGASAWAAGPRQVLEMLLGLPEAMGDAPVPEPTEADAESAWIEQHREQITQYVVEGLRRTRDLGGVEVTAWREDLEGWVDHVVGCLSATLATGDETIMLEARDWLVHVLSSRGLDSGLVSEVLDLLGDPVRSKPLATAILATSVELLASSEEPTGPLAMPGTGSGTGAGVGSDAQPARLPSRTWPPRTPST
ncbi:cobalamin B12-binding domain-containing protein [Nocardioides lentus]|uniref:Cobalamin B12-binding domain-containing protein n=1 Tax=Nocardioides lentus TaxID=338077 RepID=A0ABP5A8H4_9ACTN